MSGEFFEIRDVGVSFGGVRALDDVTVAIPAGQVCGLVGPNGSGKTTLLSVVSGLVDPTDGHVAVEGRALPTGSPARIARAGVSRTFQNLRLVADQTVLENVMTGAGVVIRRQGTRALFGGRGVYADLRSRALRALERVGMAENAARLPKELPYGHRRRVEIARALAMEPRIVLLDEPAAGMTASERDELCEVVSGIAADGITQILVEHDFALITRLCPRVVVLSSGQVIADGPPSEVAAIPAVQEAYLGQGRKVSVGAGD